MRVFLASPLGFLIGLSLGALGGGGSILAVPMLIYGAGQEPKAATATSLFLVGTASMVGLFGHWRSGRVRVGTGVTFGLVGIGGSFLGSALNRSLDPDVLLLGFSVLVVIAAWRMLTACPTCTRVGEQLTLADSLGTDGRTPVATIQAARAVTIVIAGTAVGFLTGLFGVGGGFVVVPALTLLLFLPMPEAIGTSLLVVAINASVALMTRFATDATIEWKVTIPFTIAAVAGVLSGAKVADRIDSERSLRWFAALLVAVAVYTATRALQGVMLHF
ncbi:MAG: sulfite exporter TauE/SafE family protein [Acidimicrobiales bacterium]